MPSDFWIRMYTVTVVTTTHVAVTDREAHNLRDLEDLVRSTLFEARLESEESTDFSARVRGFACGNVSFVDVASSAHCMSLSPRATGTATEQRSGFLIGFHLVGQTMIRQHGRVVTVNPGDIVIEELGADSEVLTLTPRFRSLLVCLTADTLGVPDRYLRDLACTPIPCQEGLPHAVSALFANLMSSPALTDPSPTASGRRRAIQRAAMQSIGLVRTMLVDELISRGTGPEVSTVQLRERIREYIDDHLRDPELTPAKVACAHYISVRQLHRLFENTGETVASVIRLGRIRQCMADLSDPLHQSASAGAIGMRWGFRSPSQFGATFKDIVGVTPNEFRITTLEPRRGELTR